MSSALVRGDRTRTPLQYLAGQCLTALVTLAPERLIPFLEPEAAATLDVVVPSTRLYALAAVRLAEATADRSLIVGEGIETTLSAMRILGEPGWAALSVGGMASLILPDFVRSVVIAADHDEPGLAAARRSAARWRHEARRVLVLVLVPDLPGTDFNDLLMHRRTP